MTLQDTNDIHEILKKDMEGVQIMINHLEDARDHFKINQPSEKLNALLKDLKESIERYYSIIFHYDLSLMNVVELGETGRREAIPFLISKIQELNYESKRLGASAIGKLAHFKEDVAKAKPYLLANLNDSASQVREYTLKALEKIDLTLEDIGPIQQLRQWEDKDYNIRVIDRIMDSFESPNNMDVAVNTEIPPDSLYLLQVIGETGASRTTEMEKIVKETDEGQRYFFKNNEYHYSYLHRSLKWLKEQGYVRSEKIDLEARGYEFFASELTESGKSLFYSLTKKNPVPSEMSLLIPKYDNLKQGYIAHIISELFRVKGYHVTESSTQVLSNGESVRIDVIIEKDNIKKFILIDTRELSEKGSLSKKMDKIYEFTKEIYFVAPTEKILYQCTKGETFRWITDKIGGFEQMKGKMNFHFATIEKVKKLDNPWETFKL